MSVSIRPILKQTILDIYPELIYNKDTFAIEEKAMATATATTAARPGYRSIRDNPAYQAFLVLRTGFVVAPILFGLEKFTNLLLLGDRGDVALRDFGLLLAALALARLATAFQPTHAAADA